VLVTAGPTREPIDPVRYITNRSSGRMGYALAAACAAAGAEVTLVSGPTALETPPGCDRVDVETAAQMHEAVMQRAGDADVFIATAAVADYRPAEVAEQKMKKSGSNISLELAATRDILADVAARHARLFTLGFAAETQDMEARARDKRERKGLDMLAGNQVGAGLAFDVADNSLYVCWQGGDTRLPQAKKTELGRQLVALMADHYSRSPKYDA
jgi:phosphopantothenoylcysteine decarboxylase/phosphopantothenate--cysteine ligase